MDGAALQIVAEEDKQCQWSEDAQMTESHDFDVPLSANTRENGYSCMKGPIKVASPTLRLEHMPLKDCTNIQTVDTFVMLNGYSGTFRTPTKTVKKPIEPVTPTANLKLLTDLASRETVFEGKTQEQYENHSTEILDENLKPLSRKDKSLGVLCIKFLERYPEYPPCDVRMDISLDEASKDLNVERRRIYDIVNVLESVQIVKRSATNLYTWLGKTHLKNTLSLLKATAEYEKLDEQIRKCSGNHPTQDTPSESETSRTDQEEDGSQARKEKSLGMMSQKFIMLFLVSKPQIVNLNLAAQILIGNSSVDYRKSTAYKTKIRRLYDIANILTSVKLIQKVHVNEMSGRKPAFQYIGPEIDDESVQAVLKDFSTTAHLSSASLIGTKRPFSRSSNSKSGRVKFPRTKSETFEPHKNLMCQRLGAKTLMRHPSLKDVCTVAEEEWRRLSSSLSLTSKKINISDAQATLSCNNQEKESAAAICILLEQMRKSNSSTAVFLSSDGKPVKVIAVSSPFTPATSSAVRMKSVIPIGELGAISQNASNVNSSVKVPVLKVPIVFKLNSLASSISKVSEDGHTVFGDKATMPLCDENRQLQGSAVSKPEVVDCVTCPNDKEMVSNKLPSLPSHIILRNEDQNVPVVVDPTWYSKMVIVNDMGTKSTNQQNPSNCITAGIDIVESTKSNPSLMNKCDSKSYLHSAVSKIGVTSAVNASATLNDMVLVASPQCSVGLPQTINLNETSKFEKKLQHAVKEVSQNLVLQKASGVLPDITVMENSPSLRFSLKSAIPSSVPETAPFAGSNWQTSTSGANQSSVMSQSMCISKPQLDVYPKLKIAS